MAANLVQVPMSEVLCFIGLGSNLGRSIVHIQTALAELAAHSKITLCEHSPMYRSEAVGPAGQPDYINAVAKIQTVLEPLGLLDVLQTIENAHQRVRRQHWGPRTLDLDILLYGNLILNSERLTVPHPFMTQRNFVLQPLADLEPELMLPDGQKIKHCLADCPMGTLVQLSL